MKISSIRIILSLAAIFNLEMEQLDLKTAFLQDDLEEKMCMEEPKGFKVKAKRILCID